MRSIILYFILFIGLSIKSLSLCAQEADDMMEVLTQTAEETGSGEAELSSLLDDLDSYRSQPLDLNNASEAELLSVPFFTQTQAEAILRYRESFGMLSTLYELIYTNAFDASDIERIQNLVILGQHTTVDKTNLKQIGEYAKHQLVAKWSVRGERAAGYDNSLDGEPPVFQGDPTKTMLRYKVTASNWFSAGITTEKDAGEKWIQHKQPDFISAHLFYKPNKTFYAIALGDFNARMGQGLILWNGYSAGKYSFPTSVIRYNQGISGFAGTDENRFLRGAATTFRFGKTELTLLGSIRKLDANVSATDSTGEPTEVSSVGSSGTHATDNQLIDRHILEEKLAAAHFRYRSTFFETGITAGTERYNLPIVPGNEPYKQFYFNGKENSVAGADYRFVWKNLSMAGEFALSGIDKTATFHTLRAEPVAGNSFALAYRNYSPDYKGLRPMAFGENAEANNESGWTAGVELAPISMVRFTAMADFWQHPWLRYRVNSPSEGHEYRLGAKISLTKWLETEIRYRFRNQEFNSSAEPISFPTAVNQKQWQFSLAAIINTRLKSSLHGYFNQYNTDLVHEAGYYLYNDWTYQPIENLKFSFRQGFFNTESYNSRIYAYEFSTPWSYSIPYLAGKGTRTAFLVSYSYHSTLTLYAKVSLSYFKGAESTGSGDNITQGPKQTEFNVLINWRFTTKRKSE